MHSVVTRCRVCGSKIAIPGECPKCPKPPPPERVVWKYELSTEDVQTIEMPQWAELLHFAEQNGKPCLWVRVDPNAPLTERRFRLAGTGHPRATGKYVGTALLEQGFFVLHLFEVSKR